MGKGIVDKLKKDFDITDEWMSLEIHPETPENGVLLSEKFAGMDMSRMMAGLKKSASAYGIEMGPLTLLSNSRLSLMASEFAKDKGNFHDLHERLFHDYFTAGKDIGDINVILDAGMSVGLDRFELEDALCNNTYLGKLQEASREAESLGINSTPTFIINGKYKITGAQPLETFKSTLREIEEMEK